MEVTRTEKRATQRVAKPVFVIRLTEQRGVAPRRTLPREARPSIFAPPNPSLR